MARRLASTLPRVAWALLLALALLAILRGVSAAHGGGTPQLSDVPAGPYRLFVWTSPEPWRAGGEAHVTVALTRVDAAGQTIPVEAAAVEIALSPVDAPDRAIALSATPLSGAGAGFYEGDTTLSQAGEWDVSVQISAADGTGSAGFVYQVQPGSQINWLLWIGGALAVLAVVGFLGTRRPRKVSA